MLDAPAPVAPVFPRQFLVDRDDLSVGRVADRVGRDLETSRSGGVGEREDLGVGMKLQAARIGLVRIRLLQPRASRSERSVGVKLHADHAQPVAVEPRRRVRNDLQRFQPVGIDHQPNIEPPCFAGAPHRLPVAQRRAHRADGGHSVAEEDFLCLRHGLVERLPLVQQRLQTQDRDERCVGLEAAVQGASVALLRRAQLVGARGASG